MRGPTKELQKRVSRELTGLPAPEERGAKEERLAEALLQLIYEQLRNGITEQEKTLPRSEKQAYSRLAVIDEWASLASYVVDRVYGAASPRPDKLVAIARRCAELLRQIGQQIEALLAPIAQYLKAMSYSIAIGIPSGITVGLAWQPNPATRQPTAAEIQEIIDRGRRAFDRINAGMG